MAKDAYILGIESSCDETSAAVVRSGAETISNVVLSQFATHRPYEGVVPELASREHLKAIIPVVKTALAEAGRDYNTVDAIAVTRGPGLAGALLVGISFAKALAFATNKPRLPSFAPFANADTRPIWSAAVCATSCSSAIPPITTSPPTLRPTR